MEETSPKLFVFVLMPFSEEFRDIYEVGIKPACRDGGAYCERVDEQMFTNNILERIFNQIAKADVIVADMTGRNPNVFYETGYAHALNKTVILLTNTANDIPFDLKHYPHIIYEGKIRTLKDQLERRIRWCVDNPRNQLTSVDINLLFSIAGAAVAESLIVSVNESSGYCYFNIDINNASGKLITPERYNLALLLSDKVEFFSPAVLSAAKLPDGRYIYTLKQEHSIFPFGWSSVDVKMTFQNVPRNMVPATLRFFTELGFKDYDFRLEPN